jgi:hypothetical protein
MIFLGLAGLIKGLPVEEYACIDGYDRDTKKGQEKK